MSNHVVERDADRLSPLLARFRALVREGVAIVDATLRPDGNLEATIRLEDGREGRFIVVFLDQDDDAPDHAPVLLIEGVAGHPSQPADQP